MMTGVRRMKLGSEGLEVSAQGLGCMGMSYKPEPDMIKLIHHALNSGVTFLDTSDMYGTPKPEPDMIKLIHHALNSGVTFLDTSDMYGPHTNEILLSKSFGISVENNERVVRGHPDYVRACCERSLKRLGVDSIDLYYQHRIDALVPIEVTLLPRYQGENLEHNKTIFEKVSNLAAKKGCTASQLALAWVHHQGYDVCPIRGTTKIENFDKNIKALSVKLTAEEMAELESFASTDAVMGDRYPSHYSTWKNSETPPLSSWKPT